MVVVKISSFFLRGSADTENKCLLSRFSVSRTGLAEKATEKSGENTAEKQKVSEIAGKGSPGAGKRA